MILFFPPSPRFVVTGAERHSHELIALAKVHGPVGWDPDDSLNKFSDGRLLPLGYRNSPMVIRAALKARRAARAADAQVAA